MRVGTKVSGEYFGVAFLGVVSDCRAVADGWEHSVTLFEPVNVLGITRESLSVVTQLDGEAIDGGTDWMEVVVNKREFHVVR